MFWHSKSNGIRQFDSRRYGSRCLASRHFEKRYHGTTPLEIQFFIPEHPLLMVYISEQNVSISLSEPLLMLSLISTF